MTDRIEISVDQIQSTLTTLLNHIRDHYGDTIEFTSDYFWSIPDAAKFDVYNKPEELTIGQVSEVCDHLAKLGTSPENLTTYHLHWFAQLLDAIAHEKIV
jgi:hypothetical protein